MLRAENLRDDLLAYERRIARLHNVLLVQHVLLLLLLDHGLLLEFLQRKALLGVGPQRDQLDSAEATHSQGSSRLEIRQGQV